MFLNKNFIFGSELVQKMNIKVANISKLRADFENDNDNYNVLKLQSATFINTKCKKLPQNFREGIAKFKNSMTTMTDKLPCAWMHEEYDVTKKQLIDSGIVTSEIVIAGKRFYHFSEEFAKTLKNKVGYVLSDVEEAECMAKGQILGSIKLSKNKYFVWY